MDSDIRLLDEFQEDSRDEPQPLLEEGLPSVGLVHFREQGTG